MKSARSCWINSLVICITEVLSSTWSVRWEKNNYIVPRNSAYKHFADFSPDMVLSDRTEGYLESMDKVCSFNLSEWRYIPGKLFTCTNTKDGVGIIVMYHHHQDIKNNAQTFLTQCDATLMINSIWI